jgi:hypothetical protein
LNRPVGAFAGSDPRTIKFYLELAQKTIGLFSIREPS